MKRAVARGLAAICSAAVLAGGCDTGAPSLAITLRSPPGPNLLDGVDTFVFSVADGQGDVEVLRRFAASAGPLTLDQVPFGAGLVFALDGLYMGATSIVSGRSCPIDIPDRDHLPAVSMFVARNGTFAAAATPAVALRLAPFAIVRADGDVLLAGGDVNGSTTAAVDVFDPRPGTWSAGAPLATARTAPALTVLANGDVLIAGGHGDGGAAVSAVEVYRNGEGFQSVADTPALALIDSAAATLPDGSGLIAGGSVAGAATTATWLFQADTLTTAAPLVVARSGHTLSAVGSGGFAAAFAIGGSDGTGAPLASIELYNPRAAGGNAFALEPAALATARTGHTATVLPSSQILIVGGRGSGGQVLASAELFDPLTVTITSAGMLAQARTGHAATLLPDGRVLVTGGADAQGRPLDSAEIYDPALNAFAAAQPLTTARAGHVAVSLCDQTVLLAGGGAGAEIYSPPR